MGGAGAAGAAGAAPDCFAAVAQLGGQSREQAAAPVVE